MNDIPATIQQETSRESQLISQVRELTKQNRLLAEEIDLLRSNESQIKAIKSSEELFRLLANTAPVMIWMADRNLDCRFLNKNWLDFTGRTIDKEKGPGWIDDVLPEDFDRIKHYIADSFNHGISFETEFRLRHHSGDYRWVFDRGVPYSDTDGNTAGYIGVCIDIDDRKKARENLSQYTKELAELNAAKDKFFSIIAHDLKSPLSGLVGITRELAKDIEQMSTGELSGCAAIMYESASQVYKLLENLLEWSNLQRKKPEVIKDEFILKDVVMNSMFVMNVTAKRKNISLTSQVDNDLMVYADVNMINTVLRNLISNAIKYSHPGAEIEINSEITDSMAVVSVTDHGVGMNQGQIDSLFKIESRQSDPGTLGETGTGLGLILCNEFIRANGGQIKVDSQPGKGSRFSFTLPVMDVLS